MRKINNWALFPRSSAFTPFKPLLQSTQIVAICGALFTAVSLKAQAPPVLWQTNVNATLFAVDSQTNVYANTNGTVITLNSLGVPFKTNSYCPVPSMRLDLRCATSRETF